MLKGRLIPTGRFPAPHPVSLPARLVTSSSANLTSATRRKFPQGTLQLSGSSSSLRSCSSVFRLGTSLVSLSATCRRHCTRHRAAAPPTLALVNIDFNPSLLLGMGLVGGGLTITSLRSVKPVVSRDLDIVIACVAWMSGGILIFQGWRLDPILFFANTLIAGAAVTFSIETYQLRAKVADLERPDAGWGADKRIRTQQPSQDPRSRRAASTLPPPREQPWDWLNRSPTSPQAQQSLNEDQYVESTPTKQRRSSQQQTQQRDDSTWRGSQQGVSSSERSRNAGSLADPDTDGYFQPASDMSWQPSTQNQNNSNFQDSARGKRAGRGSLSWNNRLEQAADETDAPYQPDSSSSRRLRGSSSDDSSSSQRQDANDDEWGDQDGYFQPGLDSASQKVSNSKGLGGRSIRSGAAQRPKSGWQPSTEDWD